MARRRQCRCAESQAARAAIAAAAAAAATEAAAEAAAAAVAIPAGVTEAAAAAMLVQQEPRARVQHTPALMSTHQVLAAGCLLSSCLHMYRMAAAAPAAAAPA